MQQTGPFFRITDRTRDIPGFDRCAIMAEDTRESIVCTIFIRGDGFLYQKKRTSPFTIFFRILFTACLIYSVVFIFQNSLQIAEQSSLRSEQVQQVVNEVAGTVGLGPFSLLVVRKMAHFAEFMMMGFWFMLCLRVYTRHFIKHVSWPLFLGLGTAVTDETIQLFVDGRGSSVKDVWIDFAGFLVGLFVALVTLMFCRMCVILFVHRHDDEELVQPEPQPQEEWDEEPEEKWEEEPLPQYQPPARPARQAARRAPEPQPRWEPVPQQEKEEEEESYDTSIEIEY